MPTACLYFVHALSPLHAGTGQGTGVIDMPIAREKATGIPYLPGSSVKGTLRDSKLIANEKLFFGPDTQGADEHAGAAQFADARLLLLPVRSLRGTFAWVTSPYLLRRVLRDMQDAKVTIDKDCTIPDLSTSQSAFVSGTTVLYQNKVVIEDLDLNAAQDDVAKAWARLIGHYAFDADGQTMLMQRLCVVHDDALSFLLNTATEVVARIRLHDQQKTVVDGQLWYEEALPTETLLVGLALGQNITAKDGTSCTDQQVITELAKINGETLQLGGKATVGRGLCQLRIAGGTV